LSGGRSFYPGAQAPLAIPNRERQLVRLSTGCVWYNGRMPAKAIALAFALPLLAAAAVRPDMLVSTAWLEQHLKDPAVLVLNVSRDRGIYDGGHIPGARLLPYADLLVTRDGVSNELPPVEKLKELFESAGVTETSRIILYADDMALMATRCYFTLDYLGLGDRVALLDGGLLKWKAENRPLAKDAPAAAPGAFTPHPRPELVASMQAVKEISAASKSATPNTPLLLDARAPEEYAATKTEGVAHPGHIPGAVNVLWGQAQVSREDSTLKPEAELRKLYEAGGVTPGRPVVAYCNSGVQATHAYFTLKYLGYQARLYDGSMSEWTAKGGEVAK
jgi:thiosulfate/3-mercaptopyruvate sulfurtransferase